MNAKFINDYDKKVKWTQSLSMIITKSEHKVYQWLSQKSVHKVYQWL